MRLGSREHLDSIIAALRLLFGAGDVVEMRALEVEERSKGRSFWANYSGYFDSHHWEDLAGAALRLTGDAAGVYVTLNPCEPALLSRRANRVDRSAGNKGHGNSTTDRDIVCRRWLPIDCDPVRPAGVSATAEEHKLALERTLEIRAWLTAQGWPEPLRASSGNGGHLLYAIDLPNDQDSLQLVKRCLQALSWTHSDERVTVDETVCNAARIWKLYGTRAAKGDHTPERPHRYATLLEPPAQRPACVSLEQLQALAERAPEAADSTGQNGKAGNNNSTFNLEEFVGQHLEVQSGPFPWQGGRKWIVTCPWNEEHTDRSGYVVQFPSGAIAAGCQHASCQHHDWQELRNQFQPASSGNGSKRKKKDDDTLKPPEIGEALERKARFLFAYETLHIYSGGLYVPEGEHWARLRTQEILGTEATRQAGNEVIYWLSNRNRVRVDLVNAGDRINVQNGLLDWSTEKLHPHSPEEPTTIQLPTRWDPDAYHQRLDQFLDEILPSPAVRGLFEEFLGYCLLQDCRYQKAAVLVGEGANGKSTLLNIVRATVGGPNVSSVTLQGLAENRFAAASLVGKMLNIYADLPRQALEESDVFKSLVTGDVIEVEQKFKPSFTFQNRAKLLFSANELPATRDLSDGFFRRWIIIPFPRRFEASTADRNLDDKLNTTEGRSYLLLLAVRGLQRLIERGGFSATPETDAAGAEYRRQCDPVKLFLEECCLREGQVSRQRLYDAYLTWCEGEGIKKPLRQEWFGRRVRAHVPDLQDYQQGPRRGHRERVLVGISLTTESQDLGDVGMFQGVL